MSFLGRFQRRLITREPGTSEGRSQERYRRAFLSASGDLLSKFITIGTSLILVPLMLDYLGTESFGIWMTLSSFTLLLAFADFGIGNGLLNAISSCSGADDPQRAAESVSSAFFVLLGIAALCGLLLMAISPFVTWSKIFSTDPSIATSDAGISLLVFLGIFLLNLPVSIAKRIRIGYQEGYIYSLCEAAGRLLGFAGVFILIQLEAGMPYLVLAVFLGPLLGEVLNAVSVFMVRPWLVPHPSRVTGQAAGFIARTGLLFFLLQVANSVATSSDNLVASHVLGPASVSIYSVSKKLFDFVNSLVMLAVLPLWPAYGEALTRGDIQWIRKTFYRSIILVGSASLLANSTLILIGPFLIGVWTGSEVHSPRSLLAGLSIWTTLSAVGSTASMLLNGLNELKIQVVIGTIMAVATLYAKILGARSFGLPGIAFASCSTYALLTLVPLSIYIPRLLDRLNASAGPRVPSRT